MRTYVVQRGDSPASIASRDDMAGCPKCSRDLVHANPHKPTVVFPNGFVSFRDLRIGEILNLPDKWFSGEMDALPPSYFKRLPHADGVTPGALSEPPPAELMLPPVVVNPPTGNFPADLQSAAKAASAAIAADPNYCTSVTHPGNPVNAAVHRFKTAWNATQSPKVPIGTGTYEVATTTALAQVLGGAPSACGAGQRPVPAPKPPPPLPKQEENLTPPSERGLSTGEKIGIAALGVAAIGTVVHLATRLKVPVPGRREIGYAP